MMKIDKTIEDYEKTARHQRWLATMNINHGGTEYAKMAKANKRRAEEYQQIANWLKDYKRLKECSEPKMVEYYGDGYADGEIVYDGAKCPNCGMDFEECDSDWEEPYCHACGQALKWETEG